MPTEQERLDAHAARAVDWKKWGPYLADRAWGTVREDYSADGSAWSYFPHDHARSKAYRWNEDGLFGICDRHQYLCFAFALWNGKDTILKERLFGLTGPQGNHGEDVKELYYYIDATPTTSYAKALYKYPHAAFPYSQLVEENKRRTRQESEYELLDTGVFKDDRYFDCLVEYAKADADDILIQMTITNRGPDVATVQLLPTLWFRNVWSWYNNPEKPNITLENERTIVANHADLGKRWLVLENPGEPLFTENETNQTVINGGPNASPYTKDAFHRYVTNGELKAVNPNHVGTKSAMRFQASLANGESYTLRLRLTASPPNDQSFSTFDEVFNTRKREADEFYATINSGAASADLKNVQRQSLAGLLWSKQFYHYDVRRWLIGDAAQPTPPESRWNGRNADWQHLSNDSVLLMPDKWEYPWYASWDLAFHCVPMAMIDPDTAKRQLVLLLREWFMHPSGQIPAYEWALADANPPVHAWATLRVFRMERKRRGGEGDIGFLKRVFQKLLINFTWWINRKDRSGHNLFQGGFLGLDNIGLFDRNMTFPDDSYLDQCDGTSWMAMYCLNMLAIALELARVDDTYQDVATKFLEHFFYIAHAMNGRPETRGDSGADLWDEQDGFYYDVLQMKDGEHTPMRVRSMVGLTPLLAVETIDADLLKKLPGFARRLQWFLDHRPELCRDIASVTETGAQQRRLFSVVNQDRLRLILSRMLDETEFLSPFGLRSLSKVHQSKPVQQVIDGKTYSVAYEPAESSTDIFGGNSNWRGPIWFPLNYLLIEALQKFDFYYGDDFKIECPTGSGNMMTLWDVAAELSRRLTAIFLRDQNGKRPVYGEIDRFQNDPNFRDLVLFYEYFHGDNGTGLGASHQTGWTALVAKLIQQRRTRSGSHRGA